MKREMYSGILGITYFLFDGYKSGQVSFYPFFPQLFKINRMFFLLFFRKEGRQGHGNAVSIARLLFLTRWLRFEIKQRKKILEGQRERMRRTNISIKQGHIIGWKVWSWALHVSSQVFLMNTLKEEGQIRRGVYNSNSSQIRFQDRFCLFSVQKGLLKVQSHLESLFRSCVIFEGSSLKGFYKRITFFAGIKQDMALKVVRCCRERFFPSIPTLFLFMIAAFNIMISSLSCFVPQGEMEESQVTILEDHPPKNQLKSLLFSKKHFIQDEIWRGVHSFWEVFFIDEEEEGLLVNSNMVQKGQGFQNC